MRKLLNCITCWKISNLCNLIQYQTVTTALGVKIILISSCYPSSTIWVTESHLALPLGYSLCYITFAFCITHCRNISSPDLKTQVSPIFLRFRALMTTLEIQPPSAPDHSNTEPGSNILPSWPLCFCSPSYTTAARMNFWCLSQSHRCPLAHPSTSVGNWGPQL